VGKIGFDFGAYPGSGAYAGRWCEGEAPRRRSRVDCAAVLNEELRMKNEEFASAVLPPILLFGVRSCQTNVSSAKVRRFRVTTKQSAVYLLRGYNWSGAFVGLS